MDASASSSAFEIYTGNLLTNLCEENKHLAEENGSLRLLRDFLNDVRIEISSDTDADPDAIEGGEVIAESELDRGFIVESSADSKLRVIIPFECEPRPLTSFGGNNSLHAKISNQSAGSFTAALDSVALVILEKENSILLALPISNAAFVYGKISGLDSIDMENIKNKISGEDNFIRFLRTGHGLNSSDVKFTPSSIDLVLDRQLFQSFDLLQSDGSDMLVPQTEEGNIRQAALSAAGNSCQTMKLLKMNHELNNELICESILLREIRTKIASIEIEYDSANVEFSFDDGSFSKDSDGTRCWAMRLPDVNISLDELNSLSLFVSGVKKEKGSTAVSIISPYGSIPYLFGEVFFSGGNCLCGFFHRVGAVLSWEELEIARTLMISGNLAPLIEMNFVFIPCALLCKISSIENVFDMIGIKHDTA